MKQIENFDTWVCRSSALGKIIIYKQITEKQEAELNRLFDKKQKSGITDKQEGTLAELITKRDNRELSASSKTFLNEVFIGEVYGVRKEAYGRVLEKGNVCEDDGFKLMNDALYPNKFISKIKEPSQNEWIKGTPDTIVEGIVYDIKNAFDLFTFGKAELSWEYEWQLKGYMFLHNLQHGRLFYCINDMPDYMIAEEQRAMFYKQRKWLSMDDPDYLKACDELEQAHKYGWMPLEERFKIWPVALFDSDIKTIIESVKAARAYLNQLLEQHKTRIEYNKLLTTHDEYIDITE